MNFHENTRIAQQTTAGGWNRPVSFAFALSYYYYGMKT